MSFGDHRARHRPYSVGQQPSIPPRRSRGQARPWPQSAVQPDRERIAGHRGADADAVLGCGSHRVHRYPPTRCVHLHQRGEALRAVPTQGDHRHRLRRGPCDPGSDRELTMSVDILHGEFGPGRVNAISDGLPNPRSMKRIPGDGAHANTLRTHRAPVPDMDPSTSSPRAWSCPAAQSLRVTLGRRPWERGRPARSGPQARHMDKRARCPRSQDVTPRAVPLGGGVAGSGVSFLSALRGPSACCGQDARAPRTSLPGPCLGWGSGRLGRVVLVGASRAFGPLRARCPRSQDVTPRAVPWVGEWPARACRSCRRFAGLRPVAGKMPALPGPCLSVLRRRLRAGFRARPRPGCSPSGKDVQCRVGRPRSARSSTCI